MTDQAEPREPRRERPGAADTDNDDASDSGRASRVPGPGTEGAEEGYHPMHAPEERRPDIEAYDVSPGDMPPSPAGGDADVGGEAAASRRTAGLPPEIERRHAHGRPTPGKEPVLGYDAMHTDDVIGWIDDEDPDPHVLRRILRYEAEHRRRMPVIDECRQRLRRFGA